MTHHINIGIITLIRDIVRNKNNLFQQRHAGFSRRMPTDCAENLLIFDTERISQVDHTAHGMPKLGVISLRHGKYYTTAFHDLQLVFVRFIFRYIVQQTGEIRLLFVCAETPRQRHRCIRNIQGMYKTLFVQTRLQ